MIEFRDCVVVVVRRGPGCWECVSLEEAFGKKGGPTLKKKSACKVETQQCLTLYSILFFPNRNPFDPIGIVSIAKSI